MTLVKIRYKHRAPYEESAKHLATLLPKMVGDALIGIKAGDVVVEVQRMAELERVGHDLTIEVETAPSTPLRIKLEECTNRLASDIKGFLHDSYGNGPTRPKSRMDIRMLPFHRVEL